MTKRIFLAGATGAVGRPLGSLLVRRGFEVFGTTRSQDKAVELRRDGIEPVVVDVYEANELRRLMAGVAPDIVVHQLTDLPPGLDPARMGEAVIRNATVRREGTKNLVEAAIASGARRMVAQSIAWTYASGPEPHGEDDALDVDAEGSRGITVGGIVELERLVLRSPPIIGTVLRYGQFYGPRTGIDSPNGTMPLHVEAAAWAAVLAVEKAAHGVFNIAEPNPHVTIDRAIRELGWSHTFRVKDTGAFPAVS